LLGRLSSKIAALWIGAAVIGRLLSIAIERSSKNWGFNPFAAPGDRARMALRRPTIVHTVENLKATVIIVGAVIWTFSILVSTTSALTLGAVAAFALSFAAQSTIKDYVSGFFFLVEDQFAIGDRVTIDGKTGEVENLSLRMTQIRTDDGRLVTLANSTITVIENATRGWSRIEVHVPTSFADAETGQGLLREVLAAVAADARWEASVLEPLRPTGIQSLSADGVVLQGWISVQPAQRIAVRNEVNRRVIETFRARGIAIGTTPTLQISQ